MKVESYVSLVMLYFKVHVFLYLDVFVYMRKGAFIFNEKNRKENDIRNRGRIVKDFNTFRCEMFF